MNLYIITAEVTTEDAAEAYGNGVKVGDPEYRLLDDYDNPGVSFDFASIVGALEWAKEHGHRVYCRHEFRECPECGGPFYCEVVLP